MMKRTLLPAFLLATIFLLVSCGDRTHYERIDLVAQMHNRWHGKWYKNAVKELNVKLYAKGIKFKKNIWHQVFSEPNSMCLKIDSMVGGRGSLVIDDTSYQFLNDSILNIERFISPIFLMTFYVYHNSPDSTKNRLTELGCDYMNSYITEWQGKNVYVMGAVEEDDKSSMQFWLDQDKMYLVRVLYKGSKAHKEIRLNNYKQIEGYWIPEKIEFFNNGEKGTVRELLSIDFPDTLDMNIFKPENFSKATW